MKIRGTFLKSKQTCYCFLCYFVFFSLKFHYFPYFELYFINELGRTINMYEINPTYGLWFLYDNVQNQAKNLKKALLQYSNIIVSKMRAKYILEMPKKGFVYILKKVLRFSWNCYGEFFRPIEIICENFSCQIAETFEKLHSPIFLSIDKRHCSWKVWCFHDTVKILKNARS